MMAHHLPNPFVRLTCPSVYYDRANTRHEQVEFRSGCVLVLSWFWVCRQPGGINRSGVSHSKGRMIQAYISLGVVLTRIRYTYLLLDGFIGNTNYTFVNSTRTSNARINKLFAKAKDAPFISYDQEFLDILGPNPEVKLVAERPNNDFAFEMGVWIPERNEVWFTSPVSSQGITESAFIIQFHFEYG